MKTPHWYTPLKVARSRLARVDNRAVKQLSRDEPSRRYKIKIKPRPPSALGRKPYCMDVNINGTTFKLVSRGQLASFLGVEYGTIYKWHQIGIFGDPYFSTVLSDGKTREYWLLSQMKCFVIVLNDLLKAGYLSIPWKRFPEQVESIHRGFSHYAAMADKQLAKGDVNTDNGDRFGVEFLD